LRWCMHLAPTRPPLKLGGCAKPWEASISVPVAIIAGLLLAAGGLVVLTGVALHARAGSRLDLMTAATRLTGELPGWLERHAGHDRGTRLRRVSTRVSGRGENALAATLIVGLARARPSRGRRGHARG
jgi:hypothetical protein